MRIGLWHWCTRRCDGEAVRQEPAGGTETAVVYTCEALVRAGCEVTAYVNTPTERVIEGVRYRPGAGFNAAVREEEYDAFGVVRHLAAFTAPVRARCRFYWSHDNLSQPFIHGAFRFFERKNDPSSIVACLSLAELGHLIDVVLPVSAWQAGVISGGVGWPAERLHVVGNGLPPGLYSGVVNLERRPPRLLYSLPPNRGLAELLEIFIKVLQQVPNAELHAYSRSTIYGATDVEDWSENGALYALAERIPGVKLHDPVDQRTLSHAMRSAAVYAYPTSTAETFCISLLEAQAAGAVPVASACGAIPERISHGEDGYLIGGDLADPAHKTRFAETIIGLLKDPAERVRLAGNAVARAHAPEYSYDAVSRRVLAALMPYTEGREATVARLDVRTLPEPYLARRLVAGGTGPALGRADLLGLEAGFSKVLGLV